MMITRLAGALWLCAVLACAGESAPAGAEAKKPPEPQKAIPGWEALTSPAEARGLYDQAVLEWLAAARKDPKSPGAELALRRIADVRGKLTSISTKPVLDALKELSAAKDAPVTAALARELLAAALRDAGKPKEADEAAAASGSIENWLMIGTFGRNIAATHDTRFSPEEKIDLEAEYDPGRCYYIAKNKWRALSANGRGEMLEPYDYLRPRGGACYLLAQVESDKELDFCTLVIDTPAAFKLWVNGQMLFDGDRYRQNLPRQVEAFRRVCLAPGWNRILIKLSSSASFRVRLLDEDGNPLALNVEKKDTLHPAIPPVMPVPRPGPPKPPYAKLPADLGTAIGDAAWGVDLRLQNLDDEAILYLKRAAAKEPDRAAWHYFLGEAYESAEHLLPASRKNLSAAEYALALKCDAGFAPARLRLADQLASENREENALEELKTALSAAPDSGLVWLEMAFIARRLGWRNETRAWLAEAEKLAADHPIRRMLAAGVYKEDGNLDRAMGEYRELLKASPANDAYRRLLAEAHGQRGEWKEAVKLLEERLKVRPNDPAAHGALVRGLESAGEFKEALKALKPLQALVPDEADSWRRMGELLTKAGDAPAARKAYAEALRLDPGDHRLRRLVERLNGVDEDFSAGWSLDIFKEIEASKKRTYERANAARILDQTVVRVYPDGAVSEFIADGERILTDKAIDKLSEIPILGEVVEARTIAKDGTIFEPTPIPGERRLTLPGLEIDASIEYKYRLEEPPRPWGGFYLNKWYFRSPQLDEPHQVSDYIVMIPKGMPHKVVKHNFIDVAERIEEKDGLVVYRWTARDRPRVDAEPHMPHFDTYLPFVEIGTERSWQDVADTFKSAYLGRTRPTALIRQTAEKLVEGQKTAAEKARAIYAFVAERVKHRAAAANAHQVLESGAGDPEMLYLALAEAAGLTAYQGRANKVPEQQSDEDEPPTWDLPDEDLFRAEVVGVRLEDGRVQWMDLSGRYLPFGTVRLPLEGAPVLAVGRSATFFDRLPKTGADEQGSALEADLDLDAAGNLKGRLSEHTFGSTGAALKEQIVPLDLAKRRTLVEAQLNSFFRGAALVEMDLPGLDSPGEPLRIACRFERAGYLTASAGGRLLCPLALRPMNLVSELAMDPTRHYPLKLSAPRVGRETIRHRLAPGLEIESLPRNVVLSGEFGAYALAFERTADGFTVSRRAIIPPQTVAPADYEKFAAFCRRLDDAEKTQVALRRSSAEKKQP